MPKYIVLRDCHYAYRYWAEGEIAEFGEGVQPPHHFELMKNQNGAQRKPVIHVPAENEDQIPKPTTMSEMNDKRKDAMPNTGMAHDPTKASKKKQALEK